jgi:hypothetical protein
VEMMRRESKGACGDLKGASLLKRMLNRMFNIASDGRRDFELEARR